LIFFSYILYGHIEFPTAKGTKSLPSRTAIDPPRAGVRWARLPLGEGGSRECFPSLVGSASLPRETSFEVRLTGISRDKTGSA